MTSMRFKSSPKIPRTPEMDIFNESKAQRLFINSDHKANIASIAQPGRANAS